MVYNDNQEICVSSPKVRRLHSSSKRRGSTDPDAPKHLHGAIFYIGYNKAMTDTKQMDGKK